MKNGKRVLLNVVSVLRLVLFSLLSLMAAEGILCWTRSSLLDGPLDYLFAYRGWYHTLEFVLCTLIFYLMVTLFRSRKDTRDYLEKTRNNRAHGIPFAFGATLRESVKETFRSELWKYGVFCIWPTVTCAYAFFKGGIPQVIGAAEPDLFGLARLGSFVEVGYILFRVQHYLFEIFYPLGVACVPLGLIVGGALFVALSSLGTTMTKRRAYRRADGKSDMVVAVLWGLLLLLLLAGAVSITVFALLSA